MQEAQDLAPPVTTSQRLVSGMLAGVFLALAVSATIYGLFFLADAAKEVVLAVATASATLFGTVFAHGFQRARELEMAGVQRARELEMAGLQRARELEVRRLQTMQENYARMLMELAPFIRNPYAKADEFATAHLLTWVVGSPEALRLTARFMDTRDYQTLDKLLWSMRADLNLDPGFSPIEGVTTKKLFPPESKSGLQRPPE